MADVHSKTTRSYNMSQIKGKNTKPEILVRKFLFSKGFRYKLHDTNLAGKPDIVLPKYKTIIFVNGCFWHAHENCKYYVLPKSNTQWWLDKLTRNKENDKSNTRKLESNGWTVISLYECQLKKDKLEATLSSLVAKLSVG